MLCALMAGSVLLSLLSSMFILEDAFELKRFALLAKLIADNIYRFFLFIYISNQTI